MNNIFFNNIITKVSQSITETINLSYSTSDVNSFKDLFVLIGKIYMKKDYH